MIGYNELYEVLRKEKYSESLQQLPKKFLEDFKEYLSSQNQTTLGDPELFSDSIAKSKKQFENAVSIFRELILKRKKKILNLVFVATETGIMKRDYENMLEIEKEVFDKLTKAFEEGDKKLANTLNNKSDKKDENKMILFKQNVDQFVSSVGKTLGPYKSGDLTNLESSIADILVEEEKAIFVDN